MKFPFLISALGVAFAQASMAAELPTRVELSGAAGTYTIEQWKKDWPGCEFEGGVKAGRVELVRADQSPPALRVHFAEKQIGPEQGGAGWRWPIGTHTGAELRYTVRFEPGFEFVKGGKLPGLCGGPENISGGRPANGRNGFSARLMWRRDGRGEAYVYHKNQPSNYGESFAFPSDFRFPIDQPIGVRLAVTMNRPGQKNGTLRVWIQLPDAVEKLVVDRTDLEWRDVDTFAVDGLYFEAFHGGGDSSWAPKTPCWAEFSSMAVRAIRQQNTPEQSP